MLRADLKIGDLMIYTSPLNKAISKGSISTVEEPRDWGAVGFIANTEIYMCPARVTWEEIEPTGGNISKWMTEESHL